MKKASGSEVGMVHGMKVTEIWETDYVKGCLATIKVAGTELSVQFGRSKKLPDGVGDFLPAKVKNGDQVVWDFNEEKSQLKDARGHMFVYADPSGATEHIIGIEGKFPEDNNGRAGICVVIPLVDLVKGTPVKMSDQIIRIGGRTPEELMELKVDLCRQFSKKWVYSSSERLIFQMRREDEEAKKQAEKEARRQEREAKVKLILGREKITVFNAKGQKLFGHPVVDGEWQCLPNKTPVVVFSEIAADGEIVGEPIETFFVAKGKARGKKKSSGLEKGNHQTEVSWEDPARVSIEAEAIILIINDRREPYPMFSKEAAQILCDKGVNSGTVAVVNDPNDDGHYPLISFKKGAMITKGYYPRAEV